MIVIMTKFLDVALRAVKKSEKVLMKYYDKFVDIKLKDDSSPLTIADTEAEEIIFQTIKKTFPNHSFLGEEGGKKGKSDYLWIIDPIDGTKNYSRGIPLFGTQIALMHKGGIIVGVSNSPAMKELVYSELGKGAYLNGKRIRVSEINKLKDAYMSFGGLKYFQRKNMVENLLKIINKTRGHRGIGDFWSYHLLARGSVDIVIEAGTKIWDIAAVSLIVKEAGGKVTELNGEEINENSTSIIATNNKLHGSVSNIMNS